MDKEVLKGLIDACGTVLGALIVGVAGGLIGRRYSRERDRQDKESQWRQHAIELTKLDLERKLKSSASSSNGPIRPSILDFLANYRDLMELGQRTPKELYETIRKNRTVSTESGEVGPKHALVAKGPSLEEIRQRAYAIYFERGCIHGRELDNWLQAERDLIEKHRAH